MVWFFELRVIGFGTMILTCPFVRWTFENHPTEARDVGGYYYLLTTQTQKEIAAVSCPREDGRMVFKPHGTFIQSYVPHLMLGGELEWESEDNLAVWLNVVVHNSFMYSSTADDLQSACFPSTLHRQICVAGFAYKYGTDRFSAEEFGRRLHPIINDLNLDNILIRKGKQT